MKVQVKMNAHMVARKAEWDRSCTHYSEAKAPQRRGVSEMIAEGRWKLFRLWQTAGVEDRVSSRFG